MAGPTPVSALIHAATMVTAGVYLIARTHVLFRARAAGAVRRGGHRRRHAAARRLQRAHAARHQTRPGVFDHQPDRLHVSRARRRRVVGAAIFHFMTHAFFKALLFLAAGIVIEALHDEHDIFRMGGLRKELPVAFWTFLIGGCSLAGLP